MRWSTAAWSLARFHRSLDGAVHGACGCHVPTHPESPEASGTHRRFRIAHSLLASLGWAARWPRGNFHVVAPPSMELPLRSL